MSINNLNIQIGRFKLTTLSLDGFKLDGGAMFGVIPKILWRRFHPADEDNRIDMVARCLLVEIDERKILIDTGLGEGRTQKFKEMYSYEREDGELQLSLQGLGLTLEDITDVVITHLHFDHNGGSTNSKCGDPKPTFPNARYYIQSRQLEHARSRFERDRASYLPEDFEPLIKAGVVELKEGDWELIPGFDVLVFNGHTPAMQLPRIKDEGKTVLYASDLIPLHSHFPLPWIMAYDLNPITTLEEKRKLLQKAVSEKWLFIFEHDPFYEAGYVELTPRGFSFMKYET